MVLQNKLGITSSGELYEPEEKLTKARAAEIFTGDLLREMPAGAVETLTFIHKHLFQDLYDFAGIIRNEDITKGGFRFTSLML